MKHNFSTYTRKPKKPTSLSLSLSLSLFCSLSSFSKSSAPAPESAPDILNTATEIRNARILGLRPGNDVGSVGHKGSGQIRQGQRAGRSPDGEEPRWEFRHHERHLNVRLERDLRQGKEFLSGARPMSGFLAVAWRCLGLSTPMPTAATARVLQHIPHSMVSCRWPSGHGRSVPPPPAPHTSLIATSPGATFDWR